MPRLSSDPAARRRLYVLLAAALLALVVGVAVGAVGEGGSETSGTSTAAGEGGRAASGAAPPAATPEAASLAAARRLSLERQVGSLVIMRFAGHPEPEYVRRALRAGRAGGVILFKDNMPSESATRAMIGRLQRAAGGDAIVCTDQEGGAIRTMLWAGPSVGQAGLGSPRAAAAVARDAARQLRRVGVNVNLAPVVDVAAPGRLLRGRAFGGDPASVAALGAASVRAYRGTGVAPVVKHFPGLGAADVNTDDAEVTLMRSPAELVASELVPFRAAVRAGAPAVMMSHALYPALDERRIASQSAAVIQKLLRGRLGFEGVVMTDSLEAAAVTARSGPGRAAVRSVHAGVDVVLTTGPGSHLRVVRALLAQARRSRSFRARVLESAARVIEFRPAAG